MRGRKLRPGYPDKPATLGEHLLKRRLDLGLRQKDVARELGVNFKTYENWEQGKYEPEVRFFPAVIRFLGYDPGPEPETLGERIQAARRRQGLSQRQLARRLGLDPATIWAWETGQVRRPYPRLTRLFEGMWRGVGEVVSRGGSLRRRAAGGVRRWRIDRRTERLWPAQSSIRGMLDL